MTESHEERPTRRHDTGHDGSAAAPRDRAYEASYYGHGSAADRWARAQLFFEAKEFTAAARILRGLVDEEPGPVAPRLLLARAYYHSAQLQRAETELRAVLERDPVEEYAHLMLGRTLERQGRAAEAAPQLRIAAALGVDTDPPQGR
ncbi:tetratricopeptide repeat protein [Streptomyces sp. NPDC048248]|uniref:tetratricopeptide repeat protein n=1 Tax=Streptomyces sp. NPDC048248 TaxID=3365523 RepID=UPI00371D3952